MRCNSAGKWRLMMAAVAMLGLAACESDASKMAATADPAPTNNLAPTDPGNVNSQALNPDDVFQHDVGNTVLFATDAYDLAPDAQTVLQRQAQWLMQYPARTATIQGHADERGTREYNLALGERRAESVRAYLVALGIDATRLQTVTYGKEQPLCGEATDSCWQGNRRGVTALNP
nr:peptidoglycan-associated lipoprotein Pal [uncultured Dongia sp.]